MHENKYTLTLYYITKMFPLINTRLMPCYVQRPKMKIFIISQSRKNRACYYYLFIIIHVFALFILSNRLGLNPQCTRSHALAEQRADPVHFFKGGRWKRGGGGKSGTFSAPNEKRPQPLNLQTFYKIHVIIMIAKLMMKRK